MHSFHTVLIISKCICFKFCFPDDSEFKKNQIHILVVFFVYIMLNVCMLCNVGFYCRVYQISVFKIQLEPDLAGITSTKMAGAGARFGR